MAQPDVPTLKNKILVDIKRDDWLFFNEEIEKFSPIFPRPTGDEACFGHYASLFYLWHNKFMPKMVQHNFFPPP